MDEITFASFERIRKKIRTVSLKQEILLFNFKWLLFPNPLSDFSSNATGTKLFYDMETIFKKRNNTLGECNTIVIAYTKYRLSR